MFFKSLMLGVTFVVILFILDILLPKIKSRYRLHKILRETRKRQKAFKNKMKELEIK